MDKATSYLLIKEAETSRLLGSLKILIPNIQAALIRLNVNAMKTIARRLPQKNIKAVEREAIGQIPGFKQNYLEAQKKIERKKIFDSYTQKPAAIATALVSSTTKNSVDEVINKGEMGVRNAKLLPLPGYITLIKLGLFAVFLAGMFASDGAILLPTMKIVLKSLSLLFSLISSTLSGAAKGADVLDKINSGEEVFSFKDSAMNFLKKSFERPHQDVSGGDMSGIGDFLHQVDPLDMN